MTSCECCRRAGAEPMQTHGRYVANLCPACVSGTHGRDKCLLCGAWCWHCARVAHAIQAHRSLFDRLSNDPDDGSLPLAPSQTYLGSVKVPWRTGKR